MKTKTKARSEGALKVLKYVKSLLISLIFTFAAIIIFAFIIKWANLSDSIITPVNLAIKAISVFLGALVLTRGASRGLLNGILFALVYTLFSFTLFSALAEEFCLGLGLIADFAFTALVGALAGLLGVNLRKK